MSFPLLSFIAALLALPQASAWTDPAPHRVQLVQVSEGVQLEVLDFGGAGRPLVLLAGLGNTAHVFDAFAPKLKTLGHVYAITRRGYGASSRPESGYDVARLGEDIIAVMDSQRIEHPVLIGHSYAGQELSYLAVTHRQQIAGLVYLDAAYRYAFDIPGQFEKDFPSLPPPPARPPAVTRQTFVVPESEDRQPPPLPSARAAIMAGGRKFTELSAPVLAIFASPHDIGAATPDAEYDRFDEALTERQARAFEQGVVGARVLRWAHASHYLFVSNEADVLKEIAVFVTTLK
jgi:pimeloyl-ACP methyl ester carboxylesterase